MDHNRHVETTRLIIDAMTALTTGTGFLVVEDICLLGEHKLKIADKQN
jgi:hypothetical protein